MKQLMYKLTNGTKVSTLREALMSGQGYTTVYENIPTPTVMSNNRATLLKENGYIKPKSR